MKGLIKKEMYCVARNPFLWLCILGDLLIGYLGARSYLLDIKTGQGATAIFDAMVFDSTGWMIVFSLVVVCLLGSGFSNRTVNNDICSGHKRKHIFFSKCIVFLLVYNILLLAYPTIGSIRMFFEIGVTNGVVTNIVHIVRIILFSLVLNSAMFSICIFIVFLFRDIAKSVSLSVIVVLSGALLMAYGTPYGWFDRFKFLKILPMQQIRYALDDHLSLFQNVSILISGILFFSFFTALAGLKFRHCELK